MFQTQYEQKPLKQFIHLLLNIVAQRSKEYIMDKKGFQNEIEISNELMDKGFSYKPEFVHYENENKEAEFFIYRSGIDEHITEKDAEEFQIAGFIRRVCSECIQHLQASISSRSKQMERCDLHMSSFRCRLHM